MKSIMKFPKLSTCCHMVSKMAPRKNESLVWKFVSMAEDGLSVICNLCQEKIVRGGKTVGKFGTTNIKRHIERKHKKEYSEVLKQKAKADRDAAALSQDVSTYLQNRKTCGTNYDGSAPSCSFEPSISSADTHILGPQLV